MRFSHRKECASVYGSTKKAVFNFPFPYVTFCYAGVLRQVGYYRSDRALLTHSKTAQSFLHSAQFHLENIFCLKNNLLFIYHFHIGLVSGDAVLFRLFKQRFCLFWEQFCQRGVPCFGVDKVTE